MTNQPGMAPAHPVVITDVDIPFWRLVGIFVKWTLAAIPATILLMIIFSVIAAVIGMMFGGLGMMIPR
jgi:hypothetical protein